MPSSSSKFKPSGLQFTPEQIQENVNKLTGGVSITIDSLIAASPVPIPEKSFEQARLLLRTLFADNDFVNLIWRYSANDGRVHPFGAGRTITTDRWLACIATKEAIPLGDAGTWFRFNPVLPIGSGKGEAYRDVDVMRFDYLLVEFDELKLDQQATVIAALPLPIISISSSGGRSLHTLVKVGATNLDEYKKISRAILGRLAAFGADRSNSNPSRMSRLPGGIRKFGVEGDGKQRLLFLNPYPKPQSIIGGPNHGTV